MASTPATAPAAVNRLEGPRARRRHHSSDTTLSGATTTTTKDAPEPGWAPRVKDAAWNTLLEVGRRTGYLEKKPRWVSETLAYSSHTSSDADDFVDEDLHWLSGDDPDDPRLALILVEKDPTQFQAASLNALQNAGNVSSKPVFHPGDSQDNLVNPNHPPNHRLKALYMRGFGPEQTRMPAIDPERGLDSLVGELRRVSFFRACKRYFDRFFFPEFNDPCVEAVYKDDTYRTSKFLCLICSIVLLVNWILGITLLIPANHYDHIFFRGIAAVFTIPLPFLIIFDVPKKANWFYQPFLLCSIWCWSFYVIWFMISCNYYQKPGQVQLFDCAQRDFVNLFFYMLALPTIALFGMGQLRLMAVIPAIAEVIVIGVLLIPRKPIWGRYIVEHAAFQVILLYMHWRKEITERVLFDNNRQLRKAVRDYRILAANQQRIEAARARSTGYIFHEVRQPLSAAFMAWQNLAAANIVGLDHEHRLEWETLQTKLAAMSKLLNDVLDQKRIDAGKFEIVERPYQFHYVIRTTLESARMASDRKDQRLEMVLDEDIDLEARRRGSRLEGRTEDEIADIMNRNDGHDRNGMVLGDETRLTQILTNLVNNSYKFTETGGTIRVTTKLIMPGARPGTSQSHSNVPEQLLANRNGASETPSRSPPNIVLTSATEQTLRHPPSPPTSPIPGAQETAFSRVLHENRVGATSTQTEAHTHSPVSEDVSSDVEETRSQFVPSGDPADGQHWSDDPSRIIVRMEVADTGAGISPSDVKDRKLFSQFSQAGIGRLQGNQGTGLGLSLVRRMVKLMGGRMGVDSIPDQGTTFWVELSLGVVSESEAAKEGLQEAEMYALSMPTPHLEHLPTPRSGQKGVTAPSPPLSSPTIVGTPLGMGLHSPFNSSTLSPSPRLSLQLPLSIPQYSLQPFDSSVSIASQAPPSSTPVSSAKLKVLVVDDDITTRKLLPRLLQRHNCEVQVAEDGEKALEMLGVPLFASMQPSPSRATSSSRGRKESETASSGTTNPPGSSGRTTSLRGRFPAVEPDFVPPYDLVLLDNQMPKYSGHDVVSILRQMQRRDFVVGLTGDAMPADQDRFRQAGADEVLTKPVPEAQIRAVLMKLRENTRRASQLSGTSHILPPVAEGIPLGSR